MTCPQCQRLRKQVTDQARSSRVFKEALVRDLERLAARWEADGRTGAPADLRRYLREYLK